MEPFGKHRRTSQLLWDISRVPRAGIWCNSGHFIWGHWKEPPQAPTPRAELLPELCRKERQMGRGQELPRGLNVPHCRPDLLTLMGMKCSAAFSDLKEVRQSNISWPFKT